MISDSDGIGLALREARRAARAGEVPVGAVIASADGRILGRGSNVRRRVPDPTGHAELRALRQACRRVGDFRLDREDATIFITLEPCPMCVGALLQSRISRVVWGAPEPKFGAGGSRVELTDPNLKFTHKFREVVSGVRANECAEILRQFFVSARAKASSE